jgi:hypothetical protein
MNKLEDIKNYFIARSDEIISLADRGDPWVFLCASAMIDYLTIMATGNAGRTGYISFVEKYLSQVNILYKEFEYKNGKKDLPIQMYTILRCGIVHRFSFVPSEREIANGGRRRSILLAHEKNGHTHFSTFREHNMDAVLLTAEQFSKDIKSVIELIFRLALNDENIKNNIINHIKSFLPIVAGFNDGNV